MKKEIILILAIVVVLVMIVAFYIIVVKRGELKPSATGSAASMSLNPSSGNLPVDTTLEVAINVDTAGAQTDTAAAILQFDPNDLTAIQITAGTFYPKVLSNSVENNKIIFKAGLDPAVATPITGTGILAIIKFQAKQITSKTDVDFVFTAGLNSADSSSIIEHDTDNNILATVSGANFIIGTTSSAPTVDLKIDAQDGKINKNSGETSTLSWTSSNASACTASGNWNGAKTVSGNESTGALTSSATYGLSCTGEGGTASDSVSANIKGVTPPASSESASATSSLLTTTTSKQIASIPTNIAPKAAPITNETSSELLDSGSMKPWALWFLYAIIPAFLAGGTIYFYLKRKKSNREPFV